MRIVKKGLKKKVINAYNIGIISVYARREFYAGRYDEDEAEFIVLGMKKGWFGMVRSFPDEIEKLIKVFEPFMDGDQLNNPTPEAEEAYEKVKKWAWEQGQ